jgi:hypothetical protein
VGVVAPDLAWGMSPRRRHTLLYPSHTTWRLRIKIGEGVTEIWNLRLNKRKWYSCPCWTLDGVVWSATRLRCLTPWRRDRGNQTDVGLVAGPNNLSPLTRIGRRPSSPEPAATPSVLSGLQCHISDIQRRRQYGTEGQRRGEGSTVLRGRGEEKAVWY